MSKRTEADSRETFRTGAFRTTLTPVDTKVPCEVHYWPSEGLLARVNDLIEARKRMGLRGVALCAACQTRIRGPRG